jgi:hypothetical protein
MASMASWSPQPHEAPPLAGLPVVEQRPTNQRSQPMRRPAAARRREDRVEPTVCVWLLQQQRAPQPAEVSMLQRRRPPQRVV